MVEASRGEGVSLSPPRRPQACKCGKRSTMRMQKLETECPSDRSSLKNELDDLLGAIGSSVDRAWRNLSPGEVGG
jgi:hypothetical protein